MPKSFFVKDAAALLGVSRRTVYYWIRYGRLRTVRTLGGSQRVLLESIEAQLREVEELAIRDQDAGVLSTDPSGKYPKP